jgi:hypothetical protein
MDRRAEGAIATASPRVDFDRALSRLRERAVRPVRNGMRRLRGALAVIAGPPCACLAIPARCHPLATRRRLLHTTGLSIRDRPPATFRRKRTRSDCVLMRTLRKVWSFPSSPSRARSSGGVGLSLGRGAAARATAVGAAHRRPGGCSRAWPQPLAVLMWWRPATGATRSTATEESILALQLGSSAPAP